MFAQYKISYPNEAKELSNLASNGPKFDFSKVVLKEKNVATRNYLSEFVKSLEADKFVLGGSADLASATKVAFAKSFEQGGKNIRYGIREFAMTAINNGIYLHSGIRTIDGTFLAFADYAKPAYRLGALMEIPSVHVLTHDSYQVGGDGPTHQPVEQLAMLRSTPGALVIRPCDGEEMRMAFQAAFARTDGPTFIVACRQPTPSFDRVLCQRLTPAYIVKGASNFAVSLLASGSEVGLAVAVSKKLAEEGIPSQVVSVPALQLLYKNGELVASLGLDKAPMFAIEASSDLSWFRLARYGTFAAFLAEGYGSSAPGDEVYAAKGFTVENIVPKVKIFLRRT